MNQQTKHLVARQLMSHLYLQDLHVMFKTIEYTHNWSFMVGLYFHHNSLDLKKRTWNYWGNDCGNIFWKDWKGSLYCLGYLNLQYQSTGWNVCPWNLLLEYAVFSKMHRSVVIAKCWFWRNVVYCAIGCL